jgi:hypothetical protein
MLKEDFKLDSNAEVNLSDATIIEGVTKGIYEGTDGRVRVIVGYQRPEQNPFNLEDVTVK